MPRRNFKGIRCAACGRSASANATAASCAECGGRLEVVMDLDRVSERISREKIARSRERGVWRYQDMLPVMSQSSILSLGEGNTNLLRSRALAEVLGLKRLYVKDETTNPSGAFIDRGTTLEVSRARALGFRSAACAWSGNLASSVAAYCARAGMQSKAYLPGEIDLGKLYQVVAYGAEIVPSFSRTEAENLLFEDRGKHYPVTAWNPFFLEGLKTAAVEIVDQLEWKAPDWIAVPVGSGANISMLHKGLVEIERLGLVDKVKTRLLAVQVEGCSPIADMVRGQSRRSTATSCSFARDIAVEDPAMAEEAVAAISDTCGDAAVVSEKEIIDSVDLLAKSEGIFAEPASASTVAGLRRMVDSGKVDRSDTVVLMVTGIGLKDPMMAKKLASRNRVARSMMSRLDGLPKTRRVGDTKLSVLEMLSHGADYAYSLRKRLASERGRTISLVSMYQHLSELEEMGLIGVERHERSPERRMRVYYSIMDRGAELLGQERSDS